MNSRLTTILAVISFALAAAAQTAPVIKIRSVGNEIETSWTDASAVLEQSDSLAGPWVRVPGAASPHHSPLATQPQYFRLVHGAGGEAVGSLFTVGQLASVATTIVTPGVSVYLVNQATLAQSARVKTDANGVYILSGQPPGHYQLCWEAPGFVSGCSTQQVAIVDDTVYLAPEEVTLQSDDAHHAVLGRVGFLGPAPVHRHDAFYGIDFSTIVQLGVPGVGVISTALPNSSGQFILTNVPTSGQGTLMASAEGVSVDASINLAQSDAGTLTLPNRPPRIASVIATQGGAEVKRAAPGSAVTLTATALDADNDALHFLWLPSLSQGSFVSADSSNVTWTLPNSAGVQVMYVRASDGRGGYATGRVRVSTAPEILFTGTVSDNDGAPVSDATVSLAGTLALTDANGTFSLTLSNGTAPFVITITKPGFAPISRVFDDESAGGTFTFTKPEVFLADAGKDISLTNSPGVELFIPANSLLRSDGLPVSNPVTVAFTSVDPCDPLRESPVSNIAAGSGAANAFFSSLTTAHLRIADASGAELSFAAGSKGTLALPVSAACMSNYPALPTDVGLWAYDLGAGSWSPSGTGVLRPNPLGGPVAYLSSLVAVNLNNYNAVDPSGPISFINLAVDRSVALPIDVRITGPSFAFTRTIFATPTPLVFAPSIPITFTMYDHRQAPGGYFTDLITPTATATPDAGKTINLQVNTTTPPANGVATVTLRLGNVVSGLLAGAGVGVEHAEPFLTHNFGVGNATTAANYYAAIDPLNQRATLAAWKTLNGFNAGDEAFAVYFNAGDLGFGRRMHLRRKVGADSGTDVAFYVSNHDTVEHARTGFSPIATVAMEYAYDPAHPSHGRYTKFFVFDASDNRADRANLDNNGDKFVPNLCQICHGGQHVSPGSAATGWNLYAKFIPFDMESYTYSSTATAKPGAQHNAIRTMNLAIRDNTAPTAAITALINGWYGVGGTGNFNKNFVPAAWSGGSDLPVYRDVVKPSCRACHTTRGLDFATPTGGVDFCGYNVCTAMVMPDAQRTYSLFWGSKTANVGGTGTPPNQPTMLNTRYGSGYNTAPCP